MENNVEIVKKAIERMLKKVDDENALWQALAILDHAYKRDNE